MAAAQVERAALTAMPPPLQRTAAHSRVCGVCAAEAAASEASGLRVSGCIRAPRYFNPHTRTFANKRKIIAWSSLPPARS